MNRSKRLNSVQSLAEHEELEERKTMASTVRHLEAVIERLDELKAYRYQYANNRRPDSGVGGLQWQDYHKFMQRLDQAVMEQERIVDDGRMQREAHRKRWMGKRRRLESLGRVIDRFKTEESEAEQRRQQKLQDALPRQVSPFDRNH